MRLIKKYKAKIIDIRNIDVLILFMCVVFGAVIRIVHYIKYPIPVRDAFFYKMVIDEWILQGGINSGLHIPPLSLYIIKTIAITFGYDIIKSGIIVNHLFGLGIICIIIRIAGCLLNNRLTMLLVGLIAATHPTLVYYSMQSTRENSYLFFFALSLYFFLKYFKKAEYKTLLFTAFFSMASFMCRQEGIEFFIFCIGAILFDNRFHLLEKLKRTSYFFVIYIISFVIIMNITNTPLSYLKNYFTSYQMQNSIFLREL